MREKLSDLISYFTFSVGVCHFNFLFGRFVET